MNSHQVAQNKFIEFIQSGNCTITIKNKVNDNRFTYKVIAADNNPTLFVKVLNGPDNTNNYKEMAVVSIKDGVPEVSPRRDKKITTETPCFKAFDYVFWWCLTRIKEHPQLEIWSEGRCRVCGRKLTVPESIENQIGPECATKQLPNYFKQ